MFARFLAFVLIVVVGLVALGAVLAALLSSVDLAAAFAAILVILLIVGAMAFLVGSFIRRTVVPVRGLISAAGAVADGDYTARARPTSSATIQPVVSSFNEMADRLEQADAHRRQLLADLGHELRTPLTVVKGEIEAMIDGVHRADAEHLQVLLDEVTVMERLLGDLRTLSLAESGSLTLHPELSDLSSLVADVAHAYRRVASEAGVTIEAHLDDSIGEVWIDPVRIREVVTNLVVNALNAMPDGGNVILTTRALGEAVVIEVADTGHGIAEADLEAVFDRFHRGGSSTGSGLGLTISRDLVEAHGGSLEIVASDASGTVVRAVLPRTAPP
jgi:signal transduction histidine kinase